MAVVSDKSNQLPLLSKIAMSDLHGENIPYFDGWKAYNKDPFHPTQNPQGVIQMGLAENQLLFDMLMDWERDNPKASICTPEGLSEFKRIAMFQDYHGLPEFINAMAKFMEKIRGGRVKFDPNRVVMASGATGAIEQLMFCLANRGDGVMVPTPYYPAFVRDLGWRTGLQIVPVKSESSNDFKITKEALEAAFAKAKEEKINVKGLVITNPSNPLGTTLDRETLKSLVRFVNDKNIHLVCDEIYGATVFRAPRFVSVSEIIQEVEYCNNDLIHIVYSLSKDMGIPGLRVGVVYSYNDAVVNNGRKMSSFGLVSSQTQYFLSKMLSDEQFVEKYLQEIPRRLDERYCRFTRGLQEVGISCLTSNAGLFFWMDLRILLKEQTFEAELVLWRIIINDVKLNVSPGSSFYCTEPGWFRFCFANMDDDTVEVALQRIRAFVRHSKEGDPVSKKAKLSQNMSLRLSFSSRRLDESVMSSSPHMMSPHSPMPHSPLVKAT